MDPRVKVVNGPRVHIPGGMLRTQQALPCLDSWVGWKYLSALRFSWHSIMNDQYKYENIRKLGINRNYAINLVESNYQHFEDTGM